MSLESYDVPPMAPGANSISAVAMIETDKRDKQAANGQSQHSQKIPERPRQ